MAGVFAFKEGVEKGAPVLLEPMMKFEIIVPAEYLGDVIGQITAKRANIQGTEDRPGNGKAILGLVPLSEMFGYTTNLRSATQGRGVYSQEFDHYAPVPESVAKTILG